MIKRTRHHMKFLSEKSEICLNTFYNGKGKRMKSEMLQFKLFMYLLNCFELFLLKDIQRLKVNAGQCSISKRILSGCCYHLYIFAYNTIVIISCILIYLNKLKPLTCQYVFIFLVPVHVGFTIKF